MGLMSTNPFPSMLYVEGTTPASPSSGQQRLFVRSSDHVLCMVNSAGTVTPLSGSLTNPMSAIGQMIGGTTAGAPAAIAAGTAGQFMMSSGAAVPAFASRELDYVEWTSIISVTATVEASATTIVTADAVSFDGSTAVIIEFYCPIFQPPLTSNNFMHAFLYDGSSSIGRLGSVLQPTYTPSGAVGVAAGQFMTRRLTPSNASHTYSVRGIIASGTGLAAAGAGGVGAIMPGYIRISRAV